MALFSQNMFELEVELAAHDPTYDEMVFNVGHDKSLIPFRLLWCLQRDAWAEIVLRPRFTERLSILRSR